MDLRVYRNIAVGIHNEEDDKMESMAEMRMFSGSISM